MQYSSNKYRYLYKIFRKSKHSSTQPATSIDALLKSRFRRADVSETFIYAYCVCYCTKHSLYLHISVSTFRKQFLQLNDGLCLSTGWKFGSNTKCECSNVSVVLVANVICKHGSMHIIFYFFLYTFCCFIVFIFSLFIF